MFSALFLVILNFNLAKAEIFQGGDVGNGGDACENRIQVIKSDIKEWIDLGSAQKLKLPSTISSFDYSKKMKTTLSQASYECTNKTIVVNNAEKTCKNETSIQHPKGLITCNFNKFINLTSKEEQYRLIHHEYAGLAGIETNDGQASSDYFVSNQISGFLEIVVIKKLVINKDSEFIKSNSEENYEDYVRKYWVSSTGYTTKAEVSPMNHCIAKLRSVVDTEKIDLSALNYFQDFMIESVYTYSSEENLNDKNLEVKYSAMENSGSVTVLRNDSVVNVFSIRSKNETDGISFKCMRFNEKNNGRGLAGKLKFKIFDFSVNPNSNLIVK